MTGAQDYALIALGGAVGSCIRHGLGSHIASRWGGAFPWGTMVVNVTGSLLIGAFLAFSLERAPVDPRWRYLVAVGFCGGYTTYSTFAWETAQLVSGRSLALALANAGGSAILSVVAVLAGMALARWI